MEILVVVGLLSVIILGLMMMFTQTQKAFKLGLAEVDVQEGGRTVTEMFARELLQISPAGQNGGVNFYAEIPNTPPMTQPLPGLAGDRRTNLLQEMFFLTHENQSWSGIGYRVETPASGIGALYRFATNSTYGQNPKQLFGAYNATPLSGMNRILDGVVHFKIRTYDTNGIWQTQDLPHNQDPITKVNYLKSDIRWSGNSVAPGEIGLYAYYSNAVPAFVEFEIGILESRAAARAKSIPDATVRRQYLEAQASRVHIFRMRVPVRNVDPLAYQ